jgi:hypothetical protein
LLWRAECKTTNYYVDRQSIPIDDLQF